MLYPSVELEDRITKQWQDIGFQGNDPATDFRGMGLLGLTCLQYLILGAHSLCIIIDQDNSLTLLFSYFSRSHGDVARSVLSHSHHPRYDYPYAIVVINLTSLGHGWLKEGRLDRYLYRGDQLNENSFYEIIGEPHSLMRCISSKTIRLQ